MPRAMAGAYRVAGRAHRPQARTGVSAIVRAMDGVVLVLNQNYEPLNVCNLPQGLPPRLRGEGRSDRVRPPGDPDAADRIPRALRDPAAAPDPTPAAAGEAVPARGLRARPAHLPVLRQAGPRPDARPHHAAPSRRRAHVGEPRHGLQGVQPPQGRQDARGGAAAPQPRRRSSRAATSTRCSRRTSRTSATRRGGPTCSWGGTDRGRRGAARDDLAAAIPAAVDDLLETLWAGGHAAYVVGGSLRDVVLGRDARSTGTSRPTPCPSASWRSFPGAVYENRFGTVAVRRRRRSTFEITTFRSDHDYADFRRPHRVEFGDFDRGRPRPPRLHGQRDGLGRRAGRADRAGLVDPYDGAADLAARRPARRRRPATRASRRTRCG